VLNFTIAAYWLLLGVMVFGCSTLLILVILDIRKMIEISRVNKRRSQMDLAWKNGIERLRKFDMEKKGEKRNAA
jgi:hypothetical protein